MLDTLLDSATVPASARNAFELDVRLSRFGAWYYFDIRHEDQKRWSSEISTHAERSIAGVMAQIALRYNAAAKTDVPVLFVTSTVSDVAIERGDIVDVSGVYAGVYESIGDGSLGGLPYTVLATKNADALATLVETFGVFGMVYPLGVQANLWLQIGMNSWDFVLNDRAAECLPEHVLQAFRDERLELVPASPQDAIQRKAYAEKTAADFTRPRPVRFKR